MATLVKKDMIAALVAAKKVEEFRKGQEHDSVLVGRLYRQVPESKIKELYATYIQQNPEKAIEEMTQKVEKVTKAKKSEPKVQAIKVQEVKVPKKTPEEIAEQKRRSATLDAAGNEYKKAWMLEALDAHGFSKLSKAKTIRTLKGNIYELVYNRKTNHLTALLDGNKVNDTICACEFITVAFINKYKNATKKFKK